MPCYYPLQAWRGGKNPSGKVSVVFKRRQAKNVESEFKVPCGQCVGCRLERSRQWALRCLHEAQMFEKNCFITLTYDDEHIPMNLSLDLRDFQLFMKKLRKKYGKGIRFFHAGEYGEKLNRPHYHACVFNFDFEDKELWSVRDGVRLYRSPSLDKLWEKGFCTIGDVSFESAAYVARYIMKKVTGVDAKEHYGLRKPEYVTMSRRPGIGGEWYRKFKSDIYPSDFLVCRGVKMKPPKFYDGLFEVDSPVEFKKIKRRRICSSEKKKLDNDSFRLPVKEKVKLSRIGMLKREMEAPQ